MQSQQQKQNSCQQRPQPDFEEKNNVQINVIEFQQKYYLEELVQSLINRLHNQTNIKNLPDLQVVKLSDDGQLILPQDQQWFNIWRQNLEFQNKLSLTFSYFTFSNLLQIRLGHLQLDNCQFLSFMNLPSLKRFDLGSSPIYDYKSLVKATLPSLEGLRFNILINPELKLQRSKLPNLSTLVYYTPENIPQVSLNGQFMATMNTNENVDLKFLIGINHQGKFTLVLLNKKVIRRIHRIIH